jgi:hypothetical protein
LREVARVTGAGDYIVTLSAKDAAGAELAAKTYPAVNVPAAQMIGATPQPADSFPHGAGGTTWAEPGKDAIGPNGWKFTNVHGLPDPCPVPPAPSVVTDGSGNKYIVFDPPVLWGDFLPTGTGALRAQTWFYRNGAIVNSYPNPNIVPTDPAIVPPRGHVIDLLRATHGPNDPMPWEFRVTPGTYKVIVSLDPTGGTGAGAGYTIEQDIVVA